MRAAAALRPRWWLTVRARLYAVASVAIGALLVLVAVNASENWELQRSLHNDSRTGELGGEASLPLFVAAQVERTLTAAYLANPTAEARAALEEQRQATNQGAASFRHLSGTELQTEHRIKWQHVEAVYAELDRMNEVRRQADAGVGNPDEITGYYTSLLATMVEFYQALSAMDDPDLQLETRPLVGLFWASEALAQEDTLIAQARSSGHMTPEHREAFAAAYGAQRVMYERWIVPYLPEAERVLWEEITAGAAWQTIQRVEGAMLAAPTSSTDGTVAVLPPEAEEWAPAYREVAQQVGRLNLQRTQGLLAHGYERAAEVRAGVFWQVGWSSAAVVAIAVLIVMVLRSISGRLAALQAGAEAAAGRLPEVVARLQAGGEVDAAVEFPMPPPRGDEFTDLTMALTVAHRTSVEMAAAQAADRRGFTSFVADSAGRALNGIERLLHELDRLEKKYGENVVLLRELIDVDKPAVRTRRHLDNLRTLAGSDDQPYTEPKALADLVHDAAAETDDPTGVTNEVRTDVWVRPEAVNDVVHVLAALLDNALRLSGGKDVRVTVVSAVHGIAVHIEDRGIGMEPADYEWANATLASRATFESMARHHDGRLGLFVVSHLAHRHGLQVTLRPSAYMGTLAVVLLPRDIQCPAPRSAAAVPADSPPPSVNAADGDAAARALPRREPAVRGADSRTRAPIQGEGRRPAADLPASPGREPRAVTDPAAPPLPKRRPRSHIAPQLAVPARMAPARPLAGDLSPAQISAAWGAWQSGINSAENTIAEDEQ
ncbi:sensor histidine kinase [Streptomyces millisiae]|uniref:histidine kinase n=1 Tax=Streptomyces millisiae TaxID=3075542 RepID=A0ABU2LWB6_9ACTN|nr:nitrate- and nitrite sensing domain-containing protein [Streptomyces sp. DSM 44918]MDT0321892.1 nitrate- and nitrite sensing domain-containing protein [Streptomyces sp. DSM 44918]